MVAIKKMNDSRDKGRKKMKKKYVSLVMAAMLTLGAAGLANASNAISYTALDLADVTPGQDLWQYSYTVSGDSFAMGTGFAIDFEKDLFMLTESANLTAPNAGWDVWTYTSSYDANNFVYDAYALEDNASLADTFTVDFVWTGAADAPGAQFYVVYNQNEGTVLQNGSTTAAPVPVPAALLLLGSGWAAIAGAGLRKKSKKA
jgi:hypothetical protein